MRKKLKKEVTMSVRTLDKILARLQTTLDKEVEVKKVLVEAVRDFHWMARRYADGRQTYAVGIFNDHVRKLLGLGLTLYETDGTIWAGDTTKAVTKKGK